MTRSRTLRSAVRLFLLASGGLLVLPADPQERRADEPIDSSLAGAPFRVDQA